MAIGSQIWTQSTRVFDTYISEMVGCWLPTSQLPTDNSFRDCPFRHSVLFSRDSGYRGVRILMSEVGNDIRDYTTSMRRLNRRTRLSASSFLERESVRIRVRVREHPSSKVFHFSSDRPVSQWNLSIIYHITP